MILVAVKASLEKLDFGLHLSLQQLKYVKVKQKNRLTILNLDFGLAQISIRFAHPLFTLTNLKFKLLIQRYSPPFFFSVVFFQLLCGVWIQRLSYLLLRPAEYWSLTVCRSLWDFSLLSLYVYYLQTRPTQNKSVHWSAHRTVGKREAKQNDS